MVMPAIHLSRYQVADDFTKATGVKQDSDVQRLVKVARVQLRRKFIAADMGVSGCNFAVAENGAISTVTNEGNARMTRFFGKEKSWSVGFAAWKYCVFAGVCFLVPYLACAWLLGPEFPALLAGLLGLGVVVWGTKKGFCVPKTVWEFAPHTEWDKSWTGSVPPSTKTEFRAHMRSRAQVLQYISFGAVREQ